MSTHPFRVLLVAGVSSKAQAADDKCSIPQQLADGRELCAGRGWPIVREIVVPGRSRYLVFLEDLLAKSPEFREILTVVRSGAVDLVVVRHKDRLFRTQELQQQLMAIFRRHKVQVYAFDKPHEPVPPDQLRVRAIDKFMDSVEGFRAEDEIETFLERAADNKRARILERGLHGNWARPPYGYRSAGRGQALVQVPEQVALIRLMAQWRLQERLGWKSIARRLNERGVPSPGGRQWLPFAVRRILSNRFYWGDTWWRDARGHGIHQPIFAEEDWARLQAVEAMLRGQHPREAPQYELSGLCRCAICGATMTMHNDHRRWPALLCSRSRNGYDGRMRPEERHLNRHAERDVVDYLVARAQRELADPEAFAQARRAQLGTISATELAEIDHRIQQRTLERERWNIAYEQGAIGPDELKVRRQRLEAAIDALRADRQRLETRQALAASIDVEVRQLASKVRELHAMAPLERRQIWLQLLRCVWLQRGHAPRPEWR